MPYSEPTSESQPKTVIYEERTFYVDCPCPVEGCQGKMVDTGKFWYKMPRGNHHQCSKCSHERIYPAGCKYPTSITKLIRIDQLPTNQEVVDCIETEHDNFSPPLLH